MPHSHQEINAWYLAQAGAALVLNQERLTAELLTQNIRKLLIDGTLQKNIQHSVIKIMPKKSAAKIAELVVKFAEH